MPRFAVVWLVFYAVVTLRGATPVQSPGAAPALTRILDTDEYDRAGLNKLSATELAALDAALARHAAEIAAAAHVAAGAARAAPSAVTGTAAAKFGAEQITKVAADSPAELRTQIEGTVQDVSGRAAFVLKNGQVWQMRIPDAVHFPKPLVNPDVVISRGLAGYKMAIGPTNYVLFVKRIQ